MFSALIISCILYALPAFYGFLSQRDIYRINAMFRKARRWGITVDEFDMDLLSTISDSGLFKKIGNENHCLHQLLPKVHEVPSYNLRPKPTVYNLPCPKIKKLLNSFIYRCGPDKFVIYLAVSYIHSYTFKFLVCQYLSLRLEHLNILIVCI